MSRRHTPKRRTVLKALGAAGVLGSTGVALSGAKESDQSPIVYDWYTYNDDGRGEVIQLKGGGYAAFGSDYYSMLGTADIVKFDDKGNKEWETNPDREEPNAQAFAQAPDGGIVGTRLDDGMGGAWLYVWKSAPVTDSTAPETEWEKHPEPPVDEESLGETAYEVVPETDGVVVLGKVTNAPYTPTKYVWDKGWVLKYDYDGNVLWNHVYEWDGTNTTPTGYGKHPDGGYVGVVPAAGENHDGTMVVKLDASGETEWTKTHPGTESYRKVAVTDDGHVVAAGTTSDDVPAIRAFDSAGEALWADTYDKFSKSVDVNSVEATSEGIIVAMDIGHDHDTDFDDGDRSGMLKVALDGSFEWKHITSGDTRTWTIGGITAVSDSSYVLVGGSPTHDGEHSLIAKFHERGSDGDSNGSGDGGTNGNDGSDGDENGSGDENGGSDDGNDGSSGGEGESGDGSDGSDDDSNGDDSSGSTGDGDESGDGSEGC